MRHRRMPARIAVQHLKNQGIQVRQTSADVMKNLSERRNIRTRIARTGFLCERDPRHPGESRGVSGTARSPHIS
jgi:hypothetical protein